MPISTIQMFLIYGVLEYLWYLVFCVTDGAYFSFDYFVVISFCFAINVI